MKALLVVIALLAVVLLYVLARPWLKAQPWAAPFFAWVEPLEIRLFKKSETILWARAKMAAGVLLTGLTFLGGIDFSLLMPYVPEAYRDLVQFALNMIPMALTLVGAVDEKLRNGSTKPLELVALPENTPLPPQVAIAVADAEIAKETAVAVVKQDEANA
jgi:hypothetical protein